MTWISAVYRITEADTSYICWFLLEAFIGDFVWLFQIFFQLWYNFKCIMLSFVAESEYCKFEILCQNVELFSRQVLLLLKLLKRIDNVLKGQQYLFKVWKIILNVVFVMQFFLPSYDVWKFCFLYMRICFVIEILHILCHSYDLIFFARLCYARIVLSLIFSWVHCLLNASILEWSETFIL